MIVRTLILISCLLISSQVVTLVYAGDSLDIVLKKINTDTGRINQLNDWAYQKKSTDPGYALALAQRALIESNKSKYLPGALNSYLIIGIINKNFGELGIAAENYFKALEIAEEIGNKAKQASALNNIGSVFQAQNNLAKALNYYKKSLDIEELIDNRVQVSIIQYNIGSIYEMMDSLDSANAYYNKSLLIEQELKNDEGVFYALYGIAGIELKKKDFNAVREHLDMAMKIAVNNNNLYEIALSYLEIGKLNRITGDLSKAIVSFETCIDYAKRSLHKTVVKEAYKELSDTYFQLHNSDKAYQFLNLYHILKDSIDNPDVSNKILEMESRLLLEKKQDEISELTKNIKIKAFKVRSSIRNWFLLLGTLIISTILILGNIRRFSFESKLILKYSIWILLGIVFISFILLFLEVYPGEKNFLSFLQILADVLSVAILPILIGVILFERMLMRRYVNKGEVIAVEITKYTPEKQLDQLLEIYFEVEKVTLKMLLNDFICVEANDNYQTLFYVKDGKLVKEMHRGTMKSIDNQLLVYEGIVRCHKSYIINMIHIKSIVGNTQGYRLQLLDLNFEIPVSRNFPKELLRKIKNMI